ncbi:MAG: methylthioribulose 1-phosphate dehydratase [candidate division Zixibacteria bacterium]|nr:methylthioribulose 1-phosphate dehydratase [candidate division Zixibacteria bacterium]
MNSLRNELCAVITRIASRGWCPATAGNFSVRLPGSELRMLLSPSGVDKSALLANDLLEIDARGNVLSGAGKPSAEYLLHLAVYEETAAAGRGVASCVLHVHSVWNTILSREFLPAGKLTLSGFELLKGLSSVTTHEHTETIPILENSQNMPELAKKLRVILKQQPDIHGFLLAGHGLYAFGDSIQSAYRHVEAFEFLFEVFARERARIEK